MLKLDSYIVLNADNSVMGSGDTEEKALAKATENINEFINSDIDTDYSTLFVAKVEEILKPATVQVSFVKVTEQETETGAPPKQEEKPASAPRATTSSPSKGLRRNKEEIEAGLTVELLPIYRDLKEAQGLSIEDFMDVVTMRPELSGDSSKIKELFSSSEEEDILDEDVTSEPIADILNRDAEEAQDDSVDTVQESINEKEVTAGEQNLIADSTTLEDVGETELADEHQKITREIDEDLAKENSSNEQELTEEAEDEEEEGTSEEEIEATLAENSEQADALFEEDSELNL